MNENIASLLAQAGKMQEEFAKLQQQLETQQVEGQSGAGLVKVQMNGKHHVQRVFIDSSLFKEDKVILEDMLAAAFNDAIRLVTVKAQENMGGLTSRFSLPPGFKLPF